MYIKRERSKINFTRKILLNLVNSKVHHINLVPRFGALFFICTNSKIFYVLYYKLSKKKLLFIIVSLIINKFGQTAISSDPLDWALDLEEGKVL